jgi:hypothetical protein
MRNLLFNYSLYSHPEIGNFWVWHCSCASEVAEILQRAPDAQDSARSRAQWAPLPLGIARVAGAPHQGADRREPGRAAPRWTRPR